MSYLVGLMWGCLCHMVLDLGLRVFLPIFNYFLPFPSPPNCASCFLFQHLQTYITLLQLNYIVYWFYKIPIIWSSACIYKSNPTVLIIYNNNLATCMCSLTSITVCYSIDPLCHFVLYGNFICFGGFFWTE